MDKVKRILEVVKLVLEILRLFHRLVGMCRDDIENLKFLKTVVSLVKCNLYFYAFDLIVIFTK